MTAMNLRQVLFDVACVLVLGHNQFIQEAIRHNQ
jgi:hypothetical protein